MADTELELFHAPRTRSIRVKWLLEEMGLDYRVVDVDMETRPAGDEAYAEIHPLRKVPAFREGDSQLIESLAIMQYIMGRHGPTPLDVQPDDPAYADYLKWFHFGEAGMMMPVSLLLAHTALLPERARNADMAAWAKAECDKLLKCLADTALNDHDYLAGDRFTAADISVIYMLYLLKIIRQFNDAPDAVKAYFKRCTEREAWGVATQS